MRLNFFFYSDTSKWCLGTGQLSFCLVADKSQTYSTQPQMGSFEGPLLAPETGMSIVMRSLFLLKLDFRGCSLAANWAPSVVPTHFWFLMRKSGFLTLLGWPGRASEVSPEPWQSNPAPSSSESQLLSVEDLLPPWSCEWGRQAGRKKRSEEVIYD